MKSHEITEKTSVHLRATHNTDAAGIRFINELGGIPNPSIAIHRADHLFDGMGKISLVARMNMVDPKHTPVYDADIYSARTPRRRFKTTKATFDLIKEIDQEAQRISGEKLRHTAVDELEEGFDPEDIATALASTNVGQSLYLRAQDIEVEPIWKKPTYISPAFDTEEVQEFFASLDYEWINVRYGDENYVRYSDAVKRGLTRTFTKAYDAKKAKKLVEAYFDENGLIQYNRAIYVPDDLEKCAIGKEVDDSATRAVLSELVEQYGGREAVIHWWSQRIREVYGEPYFVNARGKKIPYTLENVSAEMSRSSDPRGKEATMTYGAGNARAENACRLHSWDEICEYGERLVSKEEIDAWKIQQDMHRARLAEKLVESHPTSRRLGANPVSATWDTLDDIHRAIARFAKTSRTEKAAYGALSAVGFVDISQDQVRAFMKYAHLVLDAPTQYLEAKPNRPVRLSEFYAAIVPEDTSVGVIEILQKHGLEVVTYPKNDPYARTAAFYQLCGGDMEAMIEKGVCIDTSQYRHETPRRMRR